MEGLNAALNELKGEGNDKLRAVFLKAEGQTFCAGGDLKVSLRIVLYNQKFFAHCIVHD
jgi:enoyl-CoA hydratase/carnithine racemase